ncbi:MAG: DegT/DnrJ/EryC1/StrS family aminotransferase [Planctomycetes bacterium]|nr:DegT/DnrJ/EryC1/StrS family aminotransferase [Planctomycetota bacterium]
MSADEPIPLLDLAAVHRAQAAEIEAAVLQVLRSGRYVLGPEVDGLEKELAAYLSSGPVLGLSSGTDAILLALMTLDVGPGDEVITTPFTFFATAGTVARLGAKPVFVDIDRATHNIDPKAVEAAITPRTKAVLPVHLFGRAADLDALTAICKRRGVPIIEDCAQAIGTRIRGRSVGIDSAFGTWSFFPSKNLGAAGDAGFLTVNDLALFDKAKSLRAHGEIQRYHHRWVGGNFRIDELQAAILRVKLRTLDAENSGRRRHADLYRQAISARGLDRVLRLPAPEGDTTHSYHQFTLEVPRRDECVEFLGKRKIGCGVYYPVPLHLQECFASLGYRRGSFPQAEEAAARVLSLPVNGRLTDAQIERVVDALAEFYLR